MTLVLLGSPGRAGNNLIWTRGADDHDTERVSANCSTRGVELPEGTYHHSALAPDTGT